MSTQGITSYNQILSQDIISDAQKAFEWTLFDHTNPEDVKIVQNERSYVRKICTSEGFLFNPVDHLIRELIGRGVGHACYDDGAREFIISRIPDFKEKVLSTDYLQSFAVQYFKDHPNASKIMQIFKDSLGSENFQAFLKKARTACKENSCDYEAEIRIVLNIFPQSERLHPFEIGPIPE